MTLKKTIRNLTCVAALTAIPMHVFAGNDDENSVNNEWAPRISSEAHTMALKREEDMKFLKVAHNPFCIESTKIRLEDKKISPDVSDEKGMTALMNAATTYGAEPVIRLLLSKGANAIATNSEGKMAVELAKEALDDLSEDKSKFGIAHKNLWGSAHSRFEMLKGHFHENFPKYIKEIEPAVFKGVVAVAKKIGFDINTSYALRLTPLMLAVKAKSQNYLVLLEAGADPFVSAGDVTALVLANDNIMKTKYTEHFDIADELGIWMQKITMEKLLNPQVTEEAVVSGQKKLVLEQLVISPMVLKE